MKAFVSVITISVLALYLVQVAVNVHASTTLADGLVSYWKFDESSGTATDSGPSGNTLTNTNTVTYNASTSVHVNNHAEFSSTTSNRLEITNASQKNLNFPGAFSISMWYFPTTTVAAAGYALWSKYSSNAPNANQRAYRLYIQAAASNATTINVQQDGDGNGSTQFCSPSVTASPSIRPNQQWYHIVYTFSGASKIGTLYENGVQLGTTACPSASAFAGTAPFAIGASVDGPVELQTSGYIDEVGVWQRQLNSRDVLMLYNQGVGTSFPNNPQTILGHWF